MHYTDFRMASKSFPPGYDAFSCKTSIQGAFKCILLRGVSMLGPVTCNITSVDGSETGTVMMQSRKRLVIPQGFVHIDRSPIEKKLPIGQDTHGVEVVWHGAVNAGRPPLKAVQVDGKPMPRRFAVWSVI